jgi:hypothetical protein
LKERELERKILTSRVFKEALRHSGIRLIGYKDLPVGRKWAKKKALKLNLSKKGSAFE